MTHFVNCPVCKTSINVGVDGCVETPGSSPSMSISRADALVLVDALAAYLKFDEEIQAGRVKSPVINRTGITRSGIMALRARISAKA